MIRPSPGGPSQGFPHHRRASDPTGSSRDLQPVSSTSVATLPPPRLGSVTFSDATAVSRHEPRSNETGTDVVSGIGDDDSVADSQDALEVTPLRSAKEIEALVEENLPIASSAVAAMLTKVPSWVRRDDLYSAAVMGLFECARRWDSTCGVPFSAFARQRVKGSVLDELRKGDSAPRSVRRALRAEQQAIGELGSELGRTPTDQELAAHIGIDEARLRDARMQATMAWTTPLLLADNPDADPSAMLPDLPPTPEDVLLDRELHGYLKDAVETLPARRREVVERHFLAGEEMKSIAQDWGVTVSRVSQIAAEAVSLLREALTKLDQTEEREVSESKPSAALAAYRSQVQSASTFQSRITTKVARHDL